MDKMLFIHGWATDGGVWDRVAPRLVGATGHALTPSLPGHGGEARWLEPSLNPVLLGISKVISAEEGPIVGVGWSMGAEALLGMAAQRPEKFSALVLIGATPCFTVKQDFPYGQSKALVRRMIVDMRSNPEDTLKRFYPLNFTQAELGTEAAVSFMERYSPPGPVICESGPHGDSSTQACRRAFNYREITTALEALNNTDIRGLLGRINTPTLIIHGGDDGVVPLGAGEFLANNIKDSALEVFPSAGHAPFITESERFVELVMGFLRDIEG